MSKTILITGASGLIGNSLTRLLALKGYRIHHLTRFKSHKNPLIKTFGWDVRNKKIDSDCIKETDIIIHLAGEGIAGKRWTSQRKQNIINSRTESIRLIYSLLRQSPGHQVKKIISSSAVGYYGDRGDLLLTESTPPGTGFLSKTCVAWEQAVDEGVSLGIKTVKLRTGMVLSTEGGALPQIAKPIKLGVGTVLGSGKQWVSWIHLQDVTRMFLFAIENESVEGSFNMTAPNPVTQTELTYAIARELNKRIWLPRTPSFILKLVLGEMSSVVLDSTKTSASKIQSAGFQFNFPTIEEALASIYGNKKTH
ncbi:TIGR01777 family oxidoreductase [Rubrolithibacter danxiaensis]|uniref:TIGR01777 family oxidoreductase n=1 Tax=Rubrolithibacter danxiaensis TaxID=3390805 RepID=UPI003BF81F1D